MEENSFTLEKSLSIQQQHLNEWKTVLKPEIYEQVEEIVKKRNVGITNPYLVCRGSDISNIISNIAMGNIEIYQ
jgi:hypothetical protein